MIPFNKPYMTGKELEYIRQAVESGKISGNGMFTQKCHDFFENKYGFKKVLLTTSCTDALEMAALLINIQPGDEVIMPSYTFVSTANAFILRGAKIIFADSESLTPNLNVDKIESLITKMTRAIVPVHYAGMACDMDKIMKLAEKHSLYVIEDAAQAIDATYKGKFLGSIGHLAAFSFHETKNVISGEGGMLVVNDDAFIDRSEIIWEKGTNRASFFRGEVNKYGWVEKGSSFLPSDIVAAFLFAQLENLEVIQKKRIELWNTYNNLLQEISEKGHITLPYFHSYASNNAHMFYINCNSGQERNRLIDHLKKEGVYAVFHYLSLHKSDFYRKEHDGRVLSECERYSETLLRLPIYFELSKYDISFIVEKIKDFYD